MSPIPRVLSFFQYTERQGGMANAGRAGGIDKLPRLSTLPGRGDES